MEAGFFFFFFQRGKSDEKFAWRTGGEKERRGAKEIRKLGFMAPLQNHQG